MKIIIGNTEVIAGKTITIEEELLNPSSIVLQNVYPKSWETTHDYTQFWFPKDFSKCKILDDNNNLIYAGIVRNTGNVNLSPREPHFVDLQVIDYKSLLSEGKTLDFVLTDLTIENAINRIVEEIYDYGFRVGNIELGIQNEQIINSYSTLDQTAYDVFQYIAEITGAIWFTTFNTTDELVYIDFYSKENLPEGIELEYNNTFFKNNDIINISYNYSTNDYRNKQIITSEQVVADDNRIEILWTDGVSTTFNTEYNIYNVSSIRVNVGGTWSNKTFATTEDEAVGVDADFYYEVGTTNLNTNGTIYVMNSKIEIVYTPYVKGRQFYTNSSEVQRITGEIDRNGTITRYEDRQDVRDSQELSYIAQTYIEFKGNAEIELTIETGTSNLLELGQVVSFDAPLEDLNKTYLVKSKKSELVINNAESDNLIYENYTFTLSSNFNEETALNYFDNQRRKAQGNIELGQSISRNIDIENTINILFDNLQITEVSNINNNELEFELEGGLIE